MAPERAVSFKLGKLAFTLAAAVADAEVDPTLVAFDEVAFRVDESFDDEFPTSN